MRIYMQISAYLTGRICGPEIVKRPTDASSRILLRPEDLVGHTRVAAEPSPAPNPSGEPSSGALSASRRREFHVAESGALTVRWIDTA